jgi:hypothetical protein
MFHTWFLKVLNWTLVALDSALECLLELGSENVLHSVLKR